MTDLPDRIHVEEPDIFDGMGFWTQELITYFTDDLAARLRHEGAV